MKKITDKGRKRGPVDPPPKRRPSNGKPVKVQPKPKKGPGSGKPNFHTKAKKLGIDLRARAETIPEIKMEIDPDLMEALGKARGRPTKLTPELGSRVATCYARGDTMEEIAEHDGMPDWSTIYTWLAAPGTGPNGKLYDAFRQAFTHARELRAHTRIGIIEGLLKRTASTKAQREAGLDPLDPTAARVAIDGHRILMELENRAAYGKQLTLKGDKANPIQVQRTRVQLTREELEAIAAGGLDQAE